MTETRFEMINGTRTPVETVYVSVTDTAKLIRQSLKTAFPSVRFSVKSRKYAGGASIDVSYTDKGIARTDVEAIANKFQAVDFDGMTESTIYRPATLVDHTTYSVMFPGVPSTRFASVRFGAHYVFVRNDA